jgi:hypothetical protein
LSLEKELTKRVSSTLNLSRKLISKLETILIEKITSSILILKLTRSTTKNKILIVKSIIDIISMLEFIGKIQNSNILVEKIASSKKILNSGIEIRRRALRKFYRTLLDSKSNKYNIEHLKNLYRSIIRINSIIDNEYSENSDLLLSKVVAQHNYKLSKECKNRIMSIAYNFNEKISLLSSRDWYALNKVQDISVDSITNNTNRVNNQKNKNIFAIAASVYTNNSYKNLASFNVNKNYTDANIDLLNNQSVEIPLTHIRDSRANNNIESIIDMSTLADRGDQDTILTNTTPFYALKDSIIDF